MGMGALHCALLALAVVCVHGDGFSVVPSPGSPWLRLVPGIDAARGVAFASLDEKINTTGWASLSVATAEGKAYNDSMKAYAAGFIEGAITHDLIYDMQSTYYLLYPNNTSTQEKIVAWFTTHLAWVDSQIRTYPTNRYWIYVGLILDQVRGITDGYNAHAPKDRQFSFLQLYMLNSGGDVMDISQAVNPQLIPKWQHMTRQQALVEAAKNTHCSGFIQVDKGLKDAHFAHTTWSLYNIMLRIFKHYTFTFEQSPSPWVSFSSFPGSLSSTDDFYLLGTGLGVIETTNNLFVPDLYSKIQPQSLLCWVRTILANALATGGETWTDLFGLHNSGTYNNQWMVLDTHLVSSSHNSLPANTLWVLEQAPGLVVAKDVTEVLAAQSYWASYNIPFFEEMYNYSGYPQMLSQFGDQYSYSKCPRANIFRRDGPDATDLKGMMHLMQYNDWQHDPLSLGSSMNAISSRFDLAGNNSSMTFGGIDSKLCSLSGALDREVHAISGPTWQQQVPFSWDPLWSAQPHIGEPNTYMFTWQTMHPHPIKDVTH